MTRGERKAGEESKKQREKAGRWSMSKKTREAGKRKGKVRNCWKGKRPEKKEKEGIKMKNDGGAKRSKEEVIIKKTWKR